MTSPGPIRVNGLEHDGRGHLQLVSNIWTGSKTINSNPGGYIDRHYRVARSHT